MARRPQRFFGGQRVSTLRPNLNRLVSEVNQYVTGSRTARLLPAPLVRLEIQSLLANQLVCIDPGASGEPSPRQYTVEIPPEFTESSRGGVNYTYTDINNRVADGTEDQRLTPVYLVGDTIYAAPGVTTTGGLLDINVAGRQWARVP